MEQLYADVLFRNLHTVGTDAWTPQELPGVQTYLQDAFGVDNITHRRLVDEALTRERPSVTLSVDIQHGKIFTPTDINGLSDPFCVLYLSSSTNHRQNTTIQYQTLNPTWNEKFLLSVENLTVDVLCVEVWDYDPEETLQKKFLKIKHVRNYKAVKKLVKEVTGKNTNNFIGQCSILLKDVPAAGYSVCCKLKKPDKDKEAGEVKLRLSFGSETDSQAGFEQYRQLFDVLLQFQLKQQQSWSCGRLQPIAERILRQYGALCGLSMSATTLVRWLAYLKLGDDMSFIVLHPLLDTLAPHLLDKTKQKQFWEHTIELFLPRCLSAVRTIPNNCHDDLDTSLTVIRMLALLDNIRHSHYDPLIMEKSKLNIRTTVIDTVEEELFTRCAELMQIETSADEEARLKTLVNITNSMAFLLEYADKYLDPPFQQFLKYPYALSAYRIYSKKFVEIGMPIVTEIFKTSQPIKFNDPSLSGTFDHDPLSIGNLLWEVYLGLKRITSLGKKLTDNRDIELPLQDFHSWFYQGVIQWLYIAQYKALHCVQRCVEKDTLESDATMYAISAEHMTYVLQEVKVFLKLLDWPKCDDTYTFTVKVVDDMHESLLFYADNIIAKAQTLEAEDSPFRITGKLCKAINAILYVQQYLTSTVDDLNLQRIIDEITTATEGCIEIIQSIVHNSNDSINTKISLSLEWAASKLAPEMKQILKECAKGQHFETLTSYLDLSLQTCHYILRTNHFTLLLSKIWEHVVTSVVEIMQDGVKKGSPAVLYTNLELILKSIAKFLEQEEPYQRLQEIHQQLALYAMDTSDLIHQYYIDCLSEQNKLTADISGSLTVKLMFLEDLLKIEVLHAYKLPALCPKQNLNPYVKVQLVPENSFEGHKTKCEPIKGTQHPLFEKQFIMHLEPKQLANTKGLVRFEVKHANTHGISWANRFVGEAFVHIADIPSAKPGVTFQNLSYVQLQLKSQPHLDSDAFRVLERRQDSVAVDFVKSRNQLYEANTKKPTFRLYVKNENSLYSLYNSSALVATTKNS